MPRIEGYQDSSWILILYPEFGVTDPRNKIYALIGPAADGWPNGLAIQPNYDERITP
jgi:hypothetical protein